MKEIASVLEKRRTLPRSAGFLAIVAVVAFCALPSIGGFAAEQKTAEAPKPASAPPPLAIPLADIATRSHRSIQLTRHSDDERSGQRGH